MHVEVQRMLLIPESPRKQQIRYQGGVMMVGWGLKC